MPAHISGVLHAIPSPVWLPYPDDVNALMPSLWARNVRKDDDGVLQVAGHSVTDLADEYGTPTFVLDVDDFKHRARSFAEAFSRAFDRVGPGSRSYYAGKAFLCTAAAGWVAEAGLGLDACTLGELMVARQAGLDPRLVGLHGNNKSDEEIAFALDWGIGRLVVDSLAEIPRVAAAAAERGVRARVMIRVTVGVEAHTHDFIATAHEDQKFGLSLQSGDARRAADQILASDHLELIGLHSHIGSQIFEKDGFEVAAGRIIGLRAEIERDHGVSVPEVDLGGGFGIRYTSQDTPKSFERIAELLADVVARTCADHDTSVPFVSFEPGRAIAGPAMFTLYRAGTIKQVDTGSGHRCYVSVDGGMSDNVRTALYDADYSCTLANRQSSVEPTVVRVVGKHCESGDIVVRDEYLPGDVSAGDLIAVPGTGAYCRPLASNYNHVPRPGVLAVEGEDVRWVIRPESYQDMFASDPGFAPGNRNGE
ncbi:diaminopimelate decarboxylase [Brevibacterium daeguense]|uniref:Diaminopimelate decarboxylase n=1 Tax=Brevibacterium daeguense TaxID=909936 RepID=A0ABP8EJF8_9MICO|nr:diaminopimelate decarboxylase [Brevibacterium daeguense]